VQNPDALAQSASDPLIAGYRDMQDLLAPPVAPVPAPPFHPARAMGIPSSADQAMLLPPAHPTPAPSAAEQFRLLRLAGQAFVEATSQREVWRTLLGTLKEVCHFAACSVLLVDEAGNYELVVMARHPLGQHFLQQNIERLAFEVLRAGLPPVKLPQVAVRQILDAPDELKDEAINQVFAERIEAFIAHPLVCKGKMIGLLGLADESWGIFNKDHEDFLAALGDYAAMALENMRLRQAEQGLWEEVHLEHQRLARIVATMAEGLLIVDEDGFVHPMNPMARTLLARAGVDLGKGASSLSDVLHAPDEPWLVELGQLLTQACRRQEAVQAELVARGASESLPLTLNISASPYHDAEGRLVGAIAILNDITDRKQIEKWKDEFLSSVSHELRTPLTPIKGYTQHLLRRAERRMAEAINESADGQVHQSAPESYEHRCLGIIQSEAEHLERLVNNLLDFSLLQRGTIQLHPIDFDLAELIRMVVQSSQISAEQHRLTLNVWASDTHIFADRERVRSITGNLIDNAIKYSPSGGPVTINLLGDEQELVVTLSDKGIGVAPEDFDHLFDRFHHPSALGSHHYEGIGVSLYLAHAIIKLHGGRIWAESNRNQSETGTTFAFALPRVKEGAKGSRASASS
jgi:two-component system phosphate regulon sensor histidine kinase PhoR